MGKDREEKILEMKRREMKEEKREGRREGRRKKRRKKRRDIENGKDMRRN